jgi:hypothetical protein
VLLLYRGEYYGIETDKAPKMWPKWLLPRIVRGRYRLHDYGL